MPLYLYHCSCGAVRESFNRVSERRTNAPMCHGQMDIRLTPNMGFVKADLNYLCPVTRQPITNYRQRRRVMDENNLVDANDFKPEQGFAKAEAEQAADRQLIADLKRDLVSDRQHPSNTDLLSLFPAEAT